MVFGPVPFGLSIGQSFYKQLIMPITTIRICEEEEARQMLNDGTMDRFLRHWRKQYPGDNKLAMYRPVKHATGYTFREVKELVDNWWREVRFEIGDQLCIQYVGDEPRLYRKQGTEWAQMSEGFPYLANLSIWFDWGLGKKRPGPFRFKNYGEF